MEAGVGIEITFDEKALESSAPLIRMAIQGELYADLWGAQEAVRSNADDDPILKRAIQLFPDAIALMKMQVLTTEKPQS